MRARAAIAIAAAMLGGCSRPKAAPQSKTASPDPVRITMFYADPPEPAEGETAKLCYGTDNAISVRLDPPIERLWPTPTRCFEVPARGATYTLIAERGQEKVSQSVRITPTPPKPMLFSVSIS